MSPLSTLWGTVMCLRGETTYPGVASPGGALTQNATHVERRLGHLIPTV
jgi:hypothetical protein